MATDTLPLGNFSVSLAVKDIAASNWPILRNGAAIIGLFQGMFERNTLTFNPGWDADGGTLPDFADVREIQRRLKAAGIQPATEADESGSGPAHFTVIDPDGNPILVDQHV
jgi:hypothetical protein